jgi:hypothetical protein
MAEATEDTDEEVDVAEPMDNAVVEERRPATTVAKLAISKLHAGNSRQMPI